MNLEILSRNNRNRFIEENRLFIYNTAYKVCKRKLDWKNDDELSVSLIAFNNACDNFREDKGDFYAYAKVIIRNALIDYFRKNKNTPFLTFDDDDEAMEYVDFKASVAEYQIISENEKRAEEIGLFSIELALYGLSFNTLVDYSPSHRDTRDTLLNIAFNCIENENIMNSIKTKRLLPIKEIIILTGNKRKLIEKWRKYLIALILVLSSDEYPYLRSYLDIKVGGEGHG